MRENFGHLSPLPSLPPGYEAQPALSWRDVAASRTYELTRVYGTRAAPAGEGLVKTRYLDRGACYWSVRALAIDDGSPDGQLLHCVSYAEALRSIGKRFRFDRFCSVEVLKKELAELFFGPGQSRESNLAAPALGAFVVAH